MKHRFAHFHFTDFSTACISPAEDMPVVSLFLGRFSGSYMLTKPHSCALMVECSAL